MLWYLTIISKIPLLFKVNHKDNSHTLDYIDLKRDLDEEFLYKKKTAPRLCMLRNDYYE